MVIKTDTNKQQNFVYSNDNIFDIIKQRVTAGHDGATVFVPHVCNNIDLFGAGFAAQIAERYPIAKENYHLLGKHFLKTNLGYCQTIKIYENEKHKHKLYIVNMVAQNGIKNPKNTRPLNYFALVKSMGNLCQFINNNTGFLNKSEKIEIHCPKFGSGLAGGNWSFISDLIDDIWSNRYFVTVYNYPSKHRS